MEEEVREDRPEEKRLTNGAKRRRQASWIIWSPGPFQALKRKQVTSNLL